MKNATRIRITKEAQTIARLEYMRCATNRPAYTGKMAALFMAELEKEKREICQASTNRA